MKHHFTPGRLLFGLAGFLLGLFGEVLGNILTGSGGMVLMVFYAMLAIVSIAVLVYWFRHSENTIGELKSPVTLRSQQDKQDYARRGIIVFVSLYTPNRESPAASLSFQERLVAAERLDYSCLDLEHSNLYPAIVAITSHAARLERCWLISTTAADGDQAGSLPYVPVLIKYLREVKGMSCSFHGGRGYAVSMDDDAQVTIRTRDRIDLIFKEADKLGIGTQQMLADFTGCPRSMTLGLILACLDGSRDIQFVGTRYDEGGRPTGPLLPMVFDFEPRVF